MKDNASSIASEDQIKQRSRDVDWYHAEFEGVPPAMQHVLAEYSKISLEEQRQHVMDLRERAWDIWPFPCLGGWRFLSLNLSNMPQYKDILQRIKDGAYFLDLGCCFGQEMRQLMLDGAPSENLCGADLQPEFFGLGYELFQDKGFCKSKFIATDIFQPVSEFTALYGTVEVVYTASFFHLFDRPEQLLIAKQMASLLSKKSDSMILGRHIGDTNPGAYDHKTNLMSGKMFRHNEQTWEDLWLEAGRATETNWDVSVHLSTVTSTLKKGADPGSVRQLVFCVRRV